MRVNQIFFYYQKLSSLEQARPHVRLSTMMHFIWCHFLFAIIRSDIIIGLDIGSENSHTVLFGGDFNFKVLPTKSGKDSSPSIVTLDKILRYAGEEALPKVFPTHNVNVQSLFLL